ncbi:MAG: 2,5-diamino-6-(5-phosphoribosylamino)pyrimidin-4(3H)-one reductase [halophilic archaeon J07HX64]|jgi:2,5-diamino-6-(5-phosphoribosylamino)pyrimidin-4(3H)-one reductase (EC 1.1.1.-)|nr:MAG: 2,5-diamino-6-(5-phosphoribosylamino)pyrimidin-4(3H)-one reductase [halophilic archaeon J07HX64]
MQVVVNAAMSADGKLSSREREQIAISGPRDFDRVDALRADSDAVMVGVGTVLADDPSLTVDSERRRAERQARGDPADPARVVADSKLRTPPDAGVLSGAAETVLLAGADAPAERATRLETAGATVVRTGAEQTDLSAGLDALEDRGFDQVMVEGGGELIYSLFAAALVDRLSVYVGSLVIGGRDAPTLADGDGFRSDFPELRLDGVDQVDDGVLLEYTVE